MLILFDVDGTLTESGKKMTFEMKEILEKVKEKRKCILGIVGGGNINKILYQLGEYQFLFDYIFSECGAVIYQNRKDNFDCIHKKSMMEIINGNEELKKELDKILNEFKNIISKNNIETKGVNIDVRSGLIYLSFPGMDANDLIRNKFFEYNKKINLIQETLKGLNEICKNYIIVKGGEAGLSLTLPGWDKAQIMNIIPNIIQSKDIHFFGDKCDIDGNDYPLYSHPLIKGYSVKNYNDTMFILSNNFL